MTYIKVVLSQLTGENKKKKKIDQVFQPRFKLESSPVQSMSLNQNISFRITWLESNSWQVTEEVKEIIHG